MKFFPDTQDLIESNPTTLIGLNCIPLSGAHKAQRAISPTHLQYLVQSGPQQWSPVLATRTENGVLRIDGSHRRKAAKRFSLPTISATLPAFDPLEAVMAT